MQGCFSFDALSHHVFRLRQSEGPKNIYFRVSPPSQSVYVYENEYSKVHIVCYNM